MSQSALPTDFAPAERACEDKVRLQSAMLGDSDVLAELLDASPEVFLILNKRRQIVFGNQALLDFLGEPSLNCVLGRRPGEALGCIHSARTEGGCGTTIFCRTCGAVKAILSGIRGLRDTQECRVTRTGVREPLDLRVWATPFVLDKERFTIFVVADIGHEKRRRALERVFFHDILNTASGLTSLGELVNEAKPEEAREYGRMMADIGEILVQEINAQRDLASAEHNELEVHTERVESLAFLHELLRVYAGNRVSEGRHIGIDPSAEEVTFSSDRTLLRRVVGNMLKNAFEAVRSGETVALNCRRDGDGVEFSVHNPGHMAPDAQLQVFQRSFSTKGPGRGLGTYSMKLLSERYLGGTVSFTSTAEEGTTFRARFPLSL